MNTYASVFTIRRLWIILAVSMVVMFAILLLLALFGGALAM